MTPEQADELRQAIIECRATARAMMQADSKDFKAACDADDAARAEVNRMIRELTR